MTDKQRFVLLEKAREHLERTRQGHVQYKETGRGSEWRAALAALDKLERDLRPEIPFLGPVWSGGRPLSHQDLTHATGGIPLYPALDDAFNKEGGIVIFAPENLLVRKGSSSVPGDAFYAEGDSGIRHWVGHLVTAPAVGRRIKKGGRVGVTLKHTVGGGPHVHWGLNVERLLGPGKQLEHHTNYTHGAETVGAQLAAALT